ncbi:MAG: STAS domain-containing protein [Planctomycetes bacterium]|nr:STAS domain-containing protein [Planctomycetota bacterium]
MDNGVIKALNKGDGHVVFCLAGELTIHNAPGFHKSVLDMMTEANGDWVFDLQEVSYIDSAGVGTLVDVFRRTKKSGVRMSLVGMNRQVRSVFEITKLDKFFRIFESVQEALDS